LKHAGPPAIIRGYSFPLSRARKGIPERSRTLRIFVYEKLMLKAETDEIEFSQWPS